MFLWFQQASMGEEDCDEPKNVFVEGYPLRSRPIFLSLMSFIFFIAV